MLSLETIPNRSAKVVGRIVNDEAVLVIPELGQVKVLNDVGSFIWSKIDGSLTIGEISKEVCSEFEVDQTTAEEDTLAFLAELHQMGIVILDVE